MGEEDQGFRVVDRRGGGAGSDPEAGKAGAAAGASASPKREPGELPAIDFSTFVLSLSTSGFYHLGLVPDPETGKPTPVNRALARQTIDTLEILQRKTVGNLDPDEAHLLESLLYELRMRFVEGRG